MSVYLEACLLKAPANLLTIKFEHLLIRDDQYPGAASTKCISDPRTGALEQTTSNRDVICRSRPGDLDRNESSIHLYQISKQKSREAEARGRIDYFVQVKQRGSAPHLPIRNNRPHPGCHWKRRFHLPFRWSIIYRHSSRICNNGLHLVMVHSKNDSFLFRFFSVLSVFSVVISGKTTTDYLETRRKP